jgi:peptidoglycan/xylan/chitin deacetylase (PgdA/CDA1 family)
MKKLQRHGQLPILTYHQVSPWADDRFRKYTVTPEALSRQIAWLAAAGYTPVSLDEALGRADHGRRVAITFDDGFAECAEHAAPILRRRRFGATFYLVAGLMGGSSRWLAAEGYAEMPLMSWGQARGLAAHGSWCQSHTMTHPHLPQLPLAERLAELRDSRALVEQQVEAPVRHLAYPFGAFDARVRAEAAAAGYATAVSIQHGFARGDEDRFGLPRIFIGGQTSLLDFVCLVHSGQTARARVGSAFRAARRLAGRP